MKEELIKYKHYLIVLAALLLIKMVLVPLFEDVQSRQSTVIQAETRLGKVESLLANKEALLSFNEQQFIQMQKAKSLVYTQPEEAALKLAVQTDVEKILNKAGCEVEQLAWKGSIDVNPYLRAWQLDTRYKGDAPCLLNVTRELEQLKPLVRIKAYSYGAKQITKGKSVKVMANLELVMWQQITEAS